MIQKRLEEECLLGEGGQEEGQEGNEAVLEVNQSSRLGCSGEGLISKSSRIMLRDPIR